MKKILLLLASLFPIVATAELPVDGYYRIQNVATERYIVLNDNIINSEIDMSASKVDVSNLKSWLGFDKVKSNPGSIFYIQKVGSQYNLIAQGLSIYELSGGKKYLDIVDNGDGTYRFEMTTSYGSGRLYDSANKGEVGNAVTKKGSGTVKHGYWKLLPVNTEDNYIGLQPTVEATDGWYGTLYASYPFKLASDNVEVYYVDGVCEGQFRLKLITDEVKPAATPLVFKSNSNDPAQNKVTPVFTETTAPVDNVMSGTYFASYEDKDHYAFIEYNSSKMRVLGVDATKNLVLTTAKESDLAGGKYIPMNTCWLNVPSWLSGVFKRVDRDAYTSIRSIETSTQKSAAKGTFTLAGVPVDENKALSPGIYIKDGKKVVIP